MKKKNLWANVSSWFSSPDRINAKITEYNDKTDKVIPKTHTGFTIIEVLIVLAVAGLILLIVFLAVPALQRNARNTSRRHDAGTILAGINEYIDDNNGTLPNAYGSNTGGTLTIGNSSSSQVQTKVGYFNGGVTALNTFPTVNGTVGLMTTLTNYTAGGSADFAVVEEGATCGTLSGSTYTPTAGSARQFVVYYEVETGSNTWSAQCTAS